MTGAVEGIAIAVEVVGLAVAGGVAMTSREMIIAKRHDVIGTEARSRDRNIIHARSYGPQDSPKARLYVRSRQLLYDDCATGAVDHRRCGKLIVATNEAQLTQLDDIKAAARCIVVDNLRRLSRREVLALGSALACVGALLAPSTGIIGSHGRCLATRNSMARY